MQPVLTHTRLLHGAVLSGSTLFTIYFRNTAADIKAEDFICAWQLSLMLRSHCCVICYNCHDWSLAADRGISLKFQAWEWIRFNTNCCAWMRYDNDWSISGDTICHKFIFPSDTITYVWTGLSQWSPRWGVNLT